jgi:hypothetical protein
MLDYTKSEKLASDKHFSLLGAFVSYEETKVLWMPPPDFQVFLQLLTFLQSGKSTERIILKGEHKLNKIFFLCQKPQNAHKLSHRQSQIWHL